MPCQSFSEHIGVCTPFSKKSHKNFTKTSKNVKLSISMLTNSKEISGNQEKETRIKSMQDAIYKYATGITTANYAAKLQLEKFFDPGHFLQGIGKTPRDLFDCANYCSFLRGSVMDFARIVATVSPDGYCTSEKNPIKNLNPVDLSILKTILAVIELDKKEGIKKLQDLATKNSRFN